MNLFIFVTPYCTRSGVAYQMDSLHQVTSPFGGGWHAWALSSSRDEAQREQLLERG